MLVVISRDVIILIGSGIILTTHNNIEIEPTWWGKLTTFFQMMTIISLILELNFSWIIWTAASIFTAISGIDYIRRGINILNLDFNHHAKHKNNR